MIELGVEIRGINGLLSNCLSLLQLTEMGIGTAIIYALYKPLADNNILEIQILMQLYSKIYRVVGCAILLLGFVMSFFLNFFIEETTFPWTYIIIVYFIQVITTSSSYFYSYKRNLLYADQKMYITTLVDTGCNVAATLVKIFVMIIFKSYVIYLIVQLVQTVASNIIINVWSDKHYPYLREKVTAKYDKMEQLIYNIKNILIGRIGGFVYSSTDNLIISKFAGIIQVGYMSNYYQILNILKTLASSITQPIQPMIGNYIQEYNDIKKSYDLFLAYTFVRYCLANILTVGMVVMINPLITIWIGDEFTLSIWIAILMAIDMYIGIVHGPTGEYISVLGLFKNDKNMSIIGMCINLVFSIVLVRSFGTVGVLMGTVIAQIYYWIARAFIVFSKYFKRGVVKYIFKIIQYTGITVLDILLLNFISGKLYAQYYINFITFIMMGVICVIVSSASIVVLFFKTKEFKVLLDIVSKLFKKNLQ
jgi:O-antigen/teichoic acid export membrane protein